MLRIFFNLLIIFVLVSTFVYTQEKGYKPIMKFDPSRNAAEDINDAINEAKKSGKRIILDVGGEWCIWCHRIDDFIESDKQIKEMLDENFIVVKINYSKENKNEDLLSKYPKIEGYPHFFVLDSNGKLIHSQNTGELEKEKSYSREKFLAFLEKWSPEEEK